MVVCEVSNLNLENAEAQLVATVVSRLLCGVMMAMTPTDRGSIIGEVPGLREWWDRHEQLHHRKQEQDQAEAAGVSSPEAHEGGEEAHRWTRPPFDFLEELQGGPGRPLLPEDFG